MTPLRKRMLDELQLGNYADFTVSVRPNTQPAVVR